MPKTVRTSGEVLDFVKWAIKKKSLHKELKETPTVAEKPPVEDPVEIPSVHKDLSGHYNAWAKIADSVERENSKAEEPPVPPPGCFHDLSKERVLYEKSTREKLDGAIRLKSEGNKSFEVEDYETAVSFYKKALLQFDYTFPESPELEKEYEELKLKCHLNSAAGLINLRKLEQANLDIRAALKISPGHPKALYRKGLILLHQDKYNEAEEELNRALNASGNDVVVNNALQLLETSRRNAEILAERRAKAMFATEGSEETVEGRPPEHVGDADNGDYADPGHEDGALITQDQEASKDVFSERYSTLKAELESTLSKFEKPLETRHTLADLTSRKNSYVKQETCNSSFPVAIRDVFWISVGLAFGVLWKLEDPFEALVQCIGLLQHVTIPLCCSLIGCGVFLSLGNMLLRQELSNALDLKT